MNHLAKLSILVPVLLAAPVCFMADPAEAHGDAATLARLATRADAVAVVHVVGDVPAASQHRAVQLQTLAVLKGTLPPTVVLTAPAAPGLSGTLATAQAGTRLVVFLNTTANGYKVVHRSSAALPLAQIEVVDHVRRLLLAGAQDPGGDALRGVLADALDASHPRVARDAAAALGTDPGLLRLTSLQRGLVAAALGDALEAGDPRLPGLLLAAGRLDLEAAPDLVARAYVSGRGGAARGLQERFLTGYAPDRIAAAVSRALPRPPAQPQGIGPSTPGPAPAQILRATRLLRHADNSKAAQELLAAIAQRDQERGLTRAGDSAVTLASRVLARRGLAATRTSTGQVFALRQPGATTRTSPPSTTVPEFRCIRPRRQR